MSRKPGPLYRQWLGYRAHTIMAYTRAVTRLVRTVRPNIDIAMYVGAWYSVYYDEGSNWGSPGVRAPYAWIGDDWVRVPPNQELAIRPDVGGYTPKIEDGPWPSFPADLTSIAVAVATQARGDILIHEKMFENRLVFVDKLVSMGARIVLCDPHRVVVTGPARLYGQRLHRPKAYHPEVGIVQVRVSPVTRLRSA